MPERSTEQRKAAARVQVWGRVFQRLLYALYRQRVFVLLLVLIAGSAGTYQLWLSRTNLVNEAAASGTAPIEVSVQDVQGSGNNAYTLTLKEKNGSRRISMAVSLTEALSIALSRERSSVQLPKDQQPQAYELMREAIQEMGGRVDRVVVNDATQREYLAQVILSSNGEVKVIRARPGDAVALALKAGAPIYVEDRVLDRFGTKGSG
jgi:bifunctional DNase/RNase